MHAGILDDNEPDDSVDEKKKSVTPMSVLCKMWGEDLNCLHIVLVPVNRLLVGRSGCRFGFRGIREERVGKWKARLLVSE